MNDDLRPPAALLRVATPAPAAGNAPPGKQRPRGGPWWRSRWIALAALALTTAVAGLAIVSMRQADRSDLRAVEARQAVRRVEAGLARRTKELEARTRELREARARIRAGQVAGDATAGEMTVRQRRLDAAEARAAADRAQLKARSTALELVAAGFVTCREGTQQLLGYVLADDLANASAVMDAVFARCTAADDRLEAYRSAYGG